MTCLKLVKDHKFSLTHMLGVGNKLTHMLGVGNKLAQRRCHKIT